MNWRVGYAESALRDLARFDENTSRKIVLKIRYYAETGNPLYFAKKLNPPFENRYRFRIGEYRAIFRLGESNEIQLLLILRIKHRKDVYE